MRITESCEKNEMIDLRCALLSRVGACLVTGLMIMLTIGCSFIPYRTSHNQSVCPEGTAPTYPPFTPEAKGTICVTNGAVPVSPILTSVPRARQTFSESDQDVPDVFVGLAISGGGSRAAAFGMAVLEQLKEIGILQHVTAISTTSGGGLAGAYYATKGAGIDWGDAKQRMGNRFPQEMGRQERTPVERAFDGLHARGSIQLDGGCL